MINLLPPQDIRSLSAARTNSLLLRYAVLLGVVIVLLILEMGAMFFVVNNQKTHDEATIEESEVKTRAYAQTKKEADEFNTNLATAKYILGRQVPYTDLITTIAQGMPEYAVLDRLAIDPLTFGTPTILTVKTKSYDQSVAIKKNLQDIKVGNEPLFSSVSFQSVSQSTEAKDAFPVVAVYNVTYSKKVLAQ